MDKDYQDYLDGWFEAIVEAGVEPPWTESQWRFNERAAEQLRLDVEEWQAYNRPQ